MRESSAGVGAERGTARSDADDGTQAQPAAGTPRDMLRTYALGLIAVALTG